MVILRHPPLGFGLWLCMMMKGGAAGAERLRGFNWVHRGGETHERGSPGGCCDGGQHLTVRVTMIP